MTSSIKFNVNVPMTVTALRGNIIGDSVAELPEEMQQQWAEETAERTIRGLVESNQPLGEYTDMECGHQEATP